MVPPAGVAVEPLQPGRAGCMICMSYKNRSKSIHFLWGGVPTTASSTGSFVAGNDSVALKSGQQLSKSTVEYQATLKDSLESTEKGIAKTIDLDPEAEPAKAKVDQMEWTDAQPTQPVVNTPGKDPAGPNTHEVNVESPQKKVQHFDPPPSTVAPSEVAFDSPAKQPSYVPGSAQDPNYYKIPGLNMQNHVFGFTFSAPLQSFN